MDGAISLENDSSAARGASSQAHAEQVPLSFLRSGQTAVIRKVRGGEDFHHRLESLGFVEGAEVTVVFEQQGNLIVEVKGSQVAINRQVASKIITQ